MFGLRGSLIVSPLKAIRCVQNEPDYTSWTRDVQLVCSDTSSRFLLELLRRFVRLVYVVGAALFLCCCLPCYTCGCLGSQD